MKKKTCFIKFKLSRINKNKNVYKNDYKFSIVIILKKKTIIYKASFLNNLIKEFSKEFLL